MAVLRRSRRDFLTLAAAGPLAVCLMRPAGATTETMTAAISEFTGGAAPTPGRVLIDIPLLVENGNSVPMVVSVDSPMTREDHVTAIAVFNERNPLPDVVRFHLTPRVGIARAQTRIRLGDTQTVHAVARLSDGTYWSDSAHVIVTAPACAEG